MTQWIMDVTWAGERNDRMPVQLYGETAAT